MTMRIFSRSRTTAASVVWIACSVFVSVQPIQAALACPVRISDGKIDQGTLSVSFMNAGKTPIRELYLDCTSLEGGKPVRKACHTEAGVFYPGTPYTMHFAYAGKPSKSLDVSVESIRLQDGTIWTAGQDQACRPLKIVQK
jgi:hypothetical protein